MKKRLRKKRRLGEFQELGFLLRIKTRALSSPEQDALLDAFIDQVEALHLLAGGGISTEQGEFFITLAGRGSATDDHRRLLTEWLQRQPAVTAATAAPLQDAWYGYS